MDELFDLKLWAWQFSEAETTGVGRRVAELEAGHQVAETKVRRYPSWEAEDWQAVSEDKGYHEGQEHV